MRLVHDMFRRECALMPRLVRGVAANDLVGARVITGHIEIVSAVLRQHHQGEDELVWPLLLERCPEEVAALLELMESQHNEIEKIASEIDTATQAWRESAGFEARDALAGALDRLLPLLNEHLSMEEQRVVPIMERYITAADWNRVVETEVADADPEGLPLAFGMLIYEGDPEVIDKVISNMPPEVRSVIRELATQAFALHSELVHGTATPPRSTEL
jgi:iron-sulfur cluster repair protein YtfE (RIC family)